MDKEFIDKINIFLNENILELTISELLKFMEVILNSKYKEI